MDFYLNNDALLLSDWIVGNYYVICLGFHQINSCVIEKKS
ncbi:hypothetical protein SAMN05421765_2850 [Kaistella antarctica]|uniref:Uncharacterized protein n=1 Tax=Kaistella antarctica TaxID=266748 RepID=A0A448NRS6_9FLAO|nr:hypothetical protein SAMN05421765_2850 [Kaistella antarctica]VEH99717.1 Uncharacterised protein [Kaistella antarctica]